MKRAFVLNFFFSEFLRILVRIRLEERKEGLVMRRLSKREWKKLKVFEESEEGGFTASWTLFFTVSSSTLWKAVCVCVCFVCYSHTI